MAAGIKSIASRFSSLGRSRMSPASSHPCTRLNTLPLKMMRPTMNGKVPASTPEADQPIPLPKLETTTTAPNAPVRRPVAVSGLRRGDLARQPDRAGLLELRNVEAGFNASRDIVPVLRCRHLRSIRKTLRAEGAKRTLGAALPLPDALTGIVDVRVDMAAGQLHRGFGAAFKGNVGELHLRRLVDHAGEGFIGVL